MFLSIKNEVFIVVVLAVWNANNDGKQGKI